MAMRRRRRQPLAMPSNKLLTITNDNHYALPRVNAYAWTFTRDVTEADRQTLTCVRPAQTRATL
jgi:hypothetical protein